MNWSITVLDTGTSVIEKSIITYLTDIGQKITIPRLMFLLRGPKTIVVDTSVHSLAHALELGENLTRDPHQEPRQALKEAGVDAADVDAVVLSHLHWDHCGNNGLFPNAKFYVQRAELRYAYVPGPMFERFFMSPQAGMVPPFGNTHYELLDGESQLFPGIDVMLVPGHTPGSQALLVETKEGRVAVAGDAIYTYENLEKKIAPGVHTDVDESIRSMERIARAADLILPAHDMQVVERFAGRTIG